MMPLDITIIVRRGEDPAKCTVRPLRGTAGLSFLPYPLRQTLDFSRHILLAPDGPPLTKDDSAHPLLLLDASWRHAEKMRNAVGPITTRSIPEGWQTAYPRRSKTHADPETGLATVEALFAACCILGHRDDTLLRFYPWRELFLELNESRIR